MKHKQHELEERNIKPSVLLPAKAKHEINLPLDEGMKMLLKVEEQKKCTVLDKLVWERIEKIAQVAPIIKFMAMEGLQ